jgi:hypothetical protein
MVCGLPYLFASLVLDRVKVDFHALNGMHKEVVRQGLLYAQTRHQQTPLICQLVP